MQLQVQVWLTAGKLPTKKVGELGAQGATVMGMQGCGTRTPKAAMVAAATCGLAGEIHMPNGMIFTKGWWSMMLAAGMLLLIKRFSGSTIRVDGATPIEHINVAPLTT
jgi:hypothetical protein